MTLKKIMLWGWMEADQRRAVTAFEARGRAEVVEWVADADFSEKSYITFLYNQPDWGSFVLDKDVEPLNAYELIKFMDMFSREKRSRGLDVHELLNIAKNYFRYFVWLLSFKKIDVVLFSVMPIIGLDYVCYLAARRLNVETVMCYQSLFPNRFFFARELEDFGIFSGVSSEILGAPPAIDWGYKKDLFYMKGQVIKSRRINPSYRLLKDFLRYGIRKSKKPMRFSGAFENYTQAKEFDENYKRYAKKQTDLDLTVDFVYFPLHLQPELTTTGMGGAFSDQLDAIEVLSEMMPPGWKVYVKENPKQGFEQRGAEFFNRIRSLANVEYLSKEVNTYALMEHSRFVATITGTAGWEAITGGKPALVFGLAWYAQMPGVVRYEKGLSVNAILSQPCDQDLQKACYSGIYQKTRLGIIDGVYTSIHSDYDPSQNVQNLANFLEEVVC